jgi:Ca-activated chloride channel family protein
VGIGTAAGGPIPDPHGENGLWQDANGKHVISKLNSESLQRFAEATGGDYFVMDSNADLTAFTQAAVSKLDKHEEAFSLNKVPNDLFTPFAITALVLLVLTMLSSTEWRRSKTLFVTIFIGILTPHAEATPNPESAASYAQGLKYMQANDSTKAKEAFSLALLDEDTALQAASLYQMGQVNTTRTLAELRALYGENADEGLSDTEQTAPQVTPEALQTIVDSLKQDIQPYRDALNLQPSLARAKKNIDSIETLIKKLEEEIERLKQQQNQDNQQQQQDNQSADSQDKQQDKERQDDQQENQNQQNQQDKQNQQEQK